ncbi:hypothetical protein ACFE04_007254 [Oxalis oulophora]
MSRNCGLCSWDFFRTDLRAWFSRRPNFGSLGGWGRIRERQELESPERQQQQQQQSPFKVFTSKEVKKITNNFSNLIGEGASSSVYRGVLSNMVVAVKKMNMGDLAQSQFEAECRALGSVGGGGEASGGGS